jgi:5'-nucleotidase / UDP-sugar diphosphatase
VLRSHLGLLFLAMTACGVTRSDGPPPEAVVAPKAAAAATETAPPPGAPPAVVREGIRTIGRCDEAQKAGGKARFTIAHFNDLQARYSDRLAGRSRYAYIAGWLRQLKKEVPETLVLDAGDDYEKGAVAELRSKGESTRQMIQALPIDVRTAGNHDFAYGEEAVLRDVRLSAHPVLAANVRQEGKADADQPFRSFARVDVGCVRVGVIGLVTQNYDADDRPTKKPFDDVFVQSTRYAEVLEREVNAHRSEVDVLIALTHLGYWEDTVLAMSPRARGLDLLVGGHTEDLLKTPQLAMRRDGSRTWIMQAGHFGRTMGRADVVVDLEKKGASIERYRIVEVDASLPAADDVAELAERLERDAAPDAHRTIATTRAELKPGRDMIDLVRRAAATEWRADALLIGRDAFWGGLPKGEVTLQRLYDSVLAQRQPTGTAGFTSLWLVDVSGADLAMLRATMRGPLHELHTPPKLDPKRTYKLAIEKRALVVPKLAFGSDSARAKLADATLGGELIDLLEAYSRSQTSKGATLD